jgi:hypothetical protein
MTERVELSHLVGRDTTRTTWQNEAILQRLDLILSNLFFFFLFSFFQFRCLNSGPHAS